MSKSSQQLQHQKSSKNQQETRDPVAARDGFFFPFARQQWSKNGISFHIEDICLLAYSSPWANVYLGYIHKNSFFSDTKG